MTLVSTEPMTAPMTEEPVFGAAVVAPTAGEALPVRLEPRGSNALLWMVGCHGGAGVSTIAQMLDHAGDGERAWPGRDDESPFVVLVARESIDGLSMAHLAIRQYLTKGAPKHVRLVGLVLVAASPARKPAPAIRRHRDLVAALMPGPIWDVQWHDYLLAVTREHLPHADPRTAPVRKWSPDEHVPPDVLGVGQQAAAQVQILLTEQN